LDIGVGGSQEYQDAGYEPLVISGLASVKGAAKGGKHRALAAKPRHAAMREEYEREARRGRPYTPTDLMEEIGKRHGLRRSQSIKVLRPTEQKIRNRGKSDK